MVLRPQTHLHVQLSTLFRLSSTSLPKSARFQAHGICNGSILRGTGFARRSLLTVATPHQKSLRDYEPPEATFPPEIVQVRSEDLTEALKTVSVSSPPVSVEDAQQNDVESVDIDEYLRRRQGHPTYLKRLSPVIFIRLARLATKEHLHGVVKIVASDVVSVARMQAEDIDRLSTHNVPVRWKNYARTASVILQLSHHSYALNDLNVIDLAKLVAGRSTAADPQSLESEAKATTQAFYSLSLDSFSRILLAITRRPSGWPIDRHMWFLQALIKAVSERIYAEVDVKPVDGSIMGFPASPSKRIDDAALSRLTRALFRFVQSILERGDESLWGLAYEAFEVIVKHNLIPAEAIRKEDKDLDHVPTIIISPIIHTCLVHGWTFDAADLLHSIKVSDQKLKAHYEALVEDVIYALLDLRTPRGVRRAVDLVQSAFEHVPEFTLDNVCMEKIYDAACSCRLRDVVAELYLQLRSRYPAQSAKLLPKGPSLLLLLDTLVKRNPNKYGAKLLATHILEMRPRIAKHTTPTIVALCAEARLLEESRQLWGYYAQGADKVLVTGNPRVMVGLVKLFAGGEKRKDVQKEQFAGKSTDVGNGFESEGFQDADSAAEFASPSPRAPMGGLQSGKESEAQATQNEQTLLDREIVGEADPPDSIANPHHSSEEESVISMQVSSVDNNTISSMEQPKSFSDIREDYPESSEAEDVAIAFARKVLEEFEAAKAPLARATHFDLNAIARGRAIVGDFQGCLDILRIVIDRKEVPDIFDINIVVEALAKHDPSRAALMVDNMLKSNVMPDSVTFGTLINHALKKEDLALASRCFAQSRSLKISELTPSTISRLVEASLGAALGRYGNVSSRVALLYVQRAYDAVTSNRFPRKTFSSKIGEQGIRAALRGKSSELAFKFWDTLVRGRDNRASPEHVKLRRLIATQVRKDCERGALKKDIGHKYLDDLVGGSQERLST